MITLKKAFITLAIAITFAACGSQSAETTQDESSDLMGGSHFKVCSGQTLLTYGPDAQGVIEVKSRINCAAQGMTCRQTGSIARCTRNIPQ